MISNPSEAHDILITRAFFAVRRALKIRVFNRVGLLKHTGDNIAKIYPEAHERISTLRVKRAVLTFVVFTDVLAFIYVRIHVIRAASMCDVRGKVK